MKHTAGVGGGKEGLQEAGIAHRVNHRQAENGSWHERSIELGDFRIRQLEVDSDHPVQIRFQEESTPSDSVFHDMSLLGEFRFSFPDCSSGIVCKNLAYRFHYFHSESRHMTFGVKSKSVHLEIPLKFYVSLLPDDVDWSARLKDSLLKGYHYSSPASDMTPLMMHGVSNLLTAPDTMPMYKLFVTSQVLELLALQWNGILSHHPMAEVGSDRRLLFYSIREFLDKAYLEQLTLKAISLQFGINQFELKKGFRLYFDTTIFAYVLGKRLEYSLSLLRETTKSIKEVALTVGYHYPNHFSSAFKKYFGFSPSQLRQVAGGNENLVNESFWP